MLIFACLCIQLSRVPGEEDFAGEDDDSLSGGGSPSPTSHPSSSPRGGDAFPRPIGKEYILHMVVNRPVPWSRPSPQRMYCVVMKDDFRLAGAFTSDTTFQ